MTEAAPAATAVVMRDAAGGIEVLLLKRSSQLAFHGGAWVFPGDPAALVQLSHWTTPEGLPKRFATWFFVGRTDATQIRVDGGEIHAHAWHTPRGALAARARGEIELPPPTFVTLATLERFARAADVLAAARAAAPRVFLPRVVRIAGGSCSLYPADAGWEARDPERAGPRHRLVMLESGWSYLNEV